MFLRYIKPRVSQLLDRSFLIDLFTFKYSRKTYQKTETYKEGEILFLGPGMDYTNAKYGFIEDGQLIEIPNNGRGIPFFMQDRFMLNKGDIANFNDDKPVETSIGRYITNYMLLVDPAGSAIPYVNDVWKIGKVEDKYANLLITGKVTAAAYRQYVDNGYYLSHFGELIIPTLSERALTTDPQIKVLKAELMEKYKDQLNDPKIAAMIENRLIELDKAWIKGDVSEGYFAANGKSYTNHRKRMFGMVGKIDDFSQINSTSTVSHSLDEGLDKHNFVAVANEIRKGSYDRGKETAKGGEVAKFIIRAFQDITISTPDCGTKRGVTVTFDDNIKPSMFIGRMIITPNGLVEITDENADSFKGKTVKLRSPLTCEVKDNLCFACSGKNFERLGINNPGMQAISISSTFTNAALKAMHGTVTNVIEIDPFEFFIN